VQGLLPAFITFAQSQCIVSSQGKVARSFKHI
jgi:hypothetical protein